MKVRVSEATKLQLDCMVALSLGGTDLMHDTIATWWIKIDGKDRALKPGWAQSFCPSTDWAQGGPIIEREFMDVEVTPMGAARPGKTDLWRAWHPSDNADATVMCGPTALVAAMRCYVVSKLGVEVAVPEELK